MSKNTQNGNRYIYWLKAILLSLLEVCLCVLSIIWFIVALFVNILFGAASRGHWGSGMSYKAPWSEGLVLEEDEADDERVNYNNIRLENELLKRDILREQKRRMGI
jgi:hypothetical protein